MSRLGLQRVVVVFPGNTLFWSFLVIIAYFLDFSSHTRLVFTILEHMNGVLVLVCDVSIFS